MESHLIEQTEEELLDYLLEDFIDLENEDSIYPEFDDWAL